MNLCCTLIAKSLSTKVKSKLIHRLYTLNHTLPPDYTIATRLSHPPNKWPPSSTPSTPPSTFAPSIRTPPTRSSTASARPVHSSRSSRPCSGRNTKPNAALRQELALQLDMTPARCPVCAVLADRHVLTARRCGSRTGASLPAAECSLFMFLQGRQGKSQGRQGTKGRRGERSRRRNCRRSLKDNAHDAHDNNNDDDDLDALSVPSPAPAAPHHRRHQVRLGRLPRRAAPRQRGLPHPAPPLNPFRPAPAASPPPATIPTTAAAPCPAHPAFPAPDDLDGFDPLLRRSSVNASLQRLANNAFAGLARAKNTAQSGARRPRRCATTPACRTDTRSRAGMDTMVTAATSRSAASSPCCRSTAPRAASRWTRARRGSPRWHPPRRSPPPVRRRHPRIPARAPPLRTLRTRPRPASPSAPPANRASPARTTPILGARSRPATPPQTASSPATTQLLLVAYYRYLQIILLSQRKNDGVPRMHLQIYQGRLIVNGDQVSSLRITTTTTSTYALIQPPISNIYRHSRCCATFCDGDIW